MEKNWILYKGFEYPIIEIEGKKIDSECETDAIYRIADHSLWEDIEKDCMNGDEEANRIDEMIFFYCYPPLVANEPTEEEVIEYFKNLTF